MNYPKNIIFLIFSFVIIPSLGYSQNYPQIKTFGFDYTSTTDPTILTWLATHHDAIVGVTDYKLGKINETQYDILKSKNSNVKILSYIVNSAYTTAGFETMLYNWAKSNSHDPETIYVHYYYDTPVKIRQNVVKTSGTGTPSDRICDSTGKLLADGASGGYFLALGYGGGSAATLKDARSYQYWNAGWEPGSSAEFVG